MNESNGPVKAIKVLYKSWSRSAVKKVIPLPESGSYRKYYRIYGEDKRTVIGVCNSDGRENRAFVYLDRHLLETGNCVPEIYAVDLENDIYLEEDLGETTLLDVLESYRKDHETDEVILPMYKKVLDAMPGLQVRSMPGLDFSKCYPRAEFDGQSMMWDLNYFKYNLLKPLKIHFYEQDLEEDFLAIREYLCKAQRESFMFRDFQSRNIMLHQNRICFIDFQGGRKGPLQYDLASLLFEAKADLIPEFREILLNYYLELFADEFSWFDPEEFMRYYYGFVYLRLMQAMGAYGFRGLTEHKPVFLQSLPRALQILKWIIENHPFPLSLKSIPDVFDRLVNLKEMPGTVPEHDVLTVVINSFSYSNGTPQDRTGHGGGFVFDCRALNNPGRIDAFKDLSGKDQPVADFLEKDRGVQDFFSHSRSLVDQTIENYIHRGFRHLSVSYGCTGGRHRSVFMVEKLASHLKNIYGLNIVIQHTNLSDGL
ncbi:MAG: phosphotransferase [Bacteroidales bacterium]|nr:phosphotransferase [Bacteroidales bacterium]